MRRSCVLLLALLAVGCRGVPRDTESAPAPAPTPAYSPAAGDILDGATGRPVAFDQVMARVEDHRAVFVGENHNNDFHHAFQLRVVMAMHAQDPRLVIGMEMFQRPTQEALDRFLAGVTDEVQFLYESEYFTRWRWDWRYYRPIILFARKHRLPVIALNSPREANRRVSRGGGLGALTPREREYVAEEIDLTIADHRKFVMKVFERHPMGPGFDMEAFYASQCVWEDTMAESTARALDTHPASRIVVIVGGGHVRKRFGVPVRAERRGAKPYAILLGMEAREGEGAPTVEEMVAEDLADYLYFTEPAPKTTPSPKLGVSLRPDGPGRGLLVMKVTDGTIAAAAGVRHGDRLISLDGHRLHGLEDLRVALAVSGAEGKLVLERGGERLTVPIPFEPVAS